MAKGYRKIEKASEANIIANLKFDLDDYSDMGHFLTLEEFIDGINGFELSSYDGAPFLELDGKMVSNSEVWMWFSAVYIDEQYIITLDELNKIFGTRARILWVGE